MEHNSIIWTKETLARLKLMYTGGATNAEIGKALGISATSVRSKAVSLNLVKSGVHRKPNCVWSREAIAYLKTHYQDDDRAEIAEHLGVSVNAVKHRAAVLRLRKYKTPLIRHRSKYEFSWDEEMVRKLRELYPYYCDEYVADELDIYRCAVADKARRLGLSKDKKNYIQTKRCTKCLRRKPLSEFYVRRSNKELTPQCKECQRAYKREQYVPVRENGSYYDFHYGRAIIKHDSAVSIAWSDDMLSKMRRLYPTTKNEEMCIILNVSQSTLIRKARELGIAKNKTWLREVFSRNARKMIFKNRIHGNSGMIRPGERRSPATEFKKKSYGNET